MNKITGLRILLSITILATLSSCGILISSTSTPTPDWQPFPTYINDIPTSTAPKYGHYTPSAKFDFHLEFDYPSNWLLTEYIDEIGLPDLFIHDPRFPTLPTPFPSDHHPTPNDFGIIYVFILPSKPGQTAESEFASLKASYNQEYHIKVLTDYKTTIDGQDASVLEYQQEPIDLYISLMFERRILFMFGKQVYEILFSVAERERGGEFEQGYEYFLKSLKIVP